MHLFETKEYKNYLLVTKRIQEEDGNTSNNMNTYMKLAFEIVELAKNKFKNCGYQPKRRLNFFYLPYSWASVVEPSNATNYEDRSWQVIWSKV